MTDDDKKRTWGDVKRTIAFALAIPSYLIGMLLVKNGSEIITASGITPVAIGEIVLGVGLMAGLLVCAFYMMHARLPRIRDVNANGE